MYVGSKVNRVNNSNNLFEIGQGNDFMPKKATNKKSLGKIFCTG